MKKANFVYAALSFCIAVGAQAREVSFNEILNILGNENHQPATLREETELGVYLRGELPHYPVPSFFEFVWKGAKKSLERDAKRTINDDANYYDYLPKMLHPNGICIAGTWEITEPSNYSGQFKTGAKSLFIGRISATAENVERGNDRGFGFAGTIFPTLDENEKVKVANFFTVDVALGANTDRYLETRTTNQPETGLALTRIARGLQIVGALESADEDPGFRPITQIAKLGETNAVNSPKWMRISAARETIKNDQKDFRNEVIQAFRDNNGLEFDVDISVSTKERNQNDGWSHAGKIQISKVVVGYGCDRRLHFPHPKKN